MNKRAVSVIALCIFFFCTVFEYGACAEENSMAYTMYSTPEIEDAVLFDTYTIDFYIASDAENTFWSLCNYNVYQSLAVKKMYGTIFDRGGLSGVQRQAGGNGKALLSHREMENDQGSHIYMKRMYPKIDFGGESVGLTILNTYEWESNKWYRMVLHAFEDLETKTTFVGMWLMDTDTGTWTLYAYYDTMLPQSCLTGDLHLFVENFYHISATQEREIRIKNMYVQLHRDKSWMSLDTSVLSHCNNVANNKTGAHSFGATEEYFWLKSGGVVQDQEAYDLENPVSGRFTIQQPDTPEFAKPMIKETSLVKNNEDQWVIRWEMEQDSSPQLSYTLDVKDLDGNILLSESATRPEVIGKILEDVDTDLFMCELTVTDIYGAKVTRIVETEAYTEATAENDLPVTLPDPSLQHVQKNKRSIPVISIVLVVVVLGSCLGLLYISKRK